MVTFTTIIVRHPILRELSSFLSTLDLFHLALTSRTHHSYILASLCTFDALRRNCLCDGSGLTQRQDFAGLYSLQRRGYVWGHQRKIWQDEPIEVRLYATKCDEAGALPCRKCSINICEVSLEDPRFTHLGLSALRSSYHSRKVNVGMSILPARATTCRVSRAPPAS